MSLKDKEIKKRAENILESLSDLGNYDKFKVLIKAADKSIGVWDTVDTENIKELISKRKGN